MTVTQTEIDSLNAEYATHIGGQKTAWLAQNRVESRDVVEVMRPADRAQVYQRIDQWAEYIAPLAEAWWKVRGYGVIWPDDNSKPMKLYQLATEKAQE